MCMNGKCGRCGAACKAPEPAGRAPATGRAAGRGVDRGDPMKGDRVAGDGLGPRPAGAGQVAKKNAAEAAARARAKRF